MRKWFRDKLFECRHKRLLVSHFSGNFASPHPFLRWVEHSPAPNRTELKISSHNKLNKYYSK